jgi:NPCBM/NEW2 domain-containing protein
MSRLTLLALAFAIALATCAGAQGPANFQPSIQLLDGQSVPLSGISIAGGKVTGQGLPANLTLDDLRQIQVAPAAAAPKETGIQIQLVGGGLLRANSLTIGNDVCQVSAAGVENLSIPLEKIRAIRIGPAAKIEAVEKAIAAPSAEFDRLFLKVQEEVESVSGVTVSLSSEELKAQIEGADQAIPRSRLVALVVAQPTAKDEVTPATVTLRDGSTLPCQIDSLQEGKLLALLPPGGKLEIPWSAVASVSIRSRRVAYLSDLEPTTIEQRSIAFLDVPWRRDRSVMGRPLTLANRTFEKGIGVHATSRLTFAASGKYDELAAEIGIDAETAGKGDCVFSVLADGESVFSQRVKGSDPPRSIRVDIRGKQEVTLIVDAGEGLDLADHADWCDVRLIKGISGTSAPP